jgi:hypothetical protein
MSTTANGEAGPLPHGEFLAFAKCKLLIDPGDAFVSGSFPRPGVEPPTQYLAPGTGAKGYSAAALRRTSKFSAD